MHSLAYYIAHSLKHAIRTAFGRNLDPQVLPTAFSAANQFSCSISEQIYQQFQKEGFKYVQSGITPGRISEQILTHFQKPAELQSASIDPKGNIQFQVSPSYALKLANQLIFRDQSLLGKTNQKFTVLLPSNNMLAPLQPIDIRFISTAKFIHKANQALSSPSEVRSFVVNQSVLAGISIKIIADGLPFSWATKDQLVIKYMQQQGIQQIQDLVERDRLLLSSVPVNNQMGRVHRELVQRRQGQLTQIGQYFDLPINCQTIKLAKNKRKQEYLADMRQGVLSQSEEGLKHLPSGLILHDKHGYFTVKGIHFFICNYLADRSLIFLGTSSQDLSPEYKPEAQRIHCADILINSDQGRPISDFRVILEAFDKMDKLTGRQRSAAKALAFAIHKNPLHYPLSTSLIQLFTDAMAITYDTHSSLQLVHPSLQQSLQWTKAGDLLHLSRQEGCGRRLIQWLQGWKVYDQQSKFRKKVQNLIFEIML